MDDKFKPTQINLANLWALLQARISIYNVCDQSNCSEKTIGSREYSEKKMKMQLVIENSIIGRDYIAKNKLKKSKPQCLINLFCHLRS